MRGIRNNCMKILLKAESQIPKAESQIPKAVKVQILTSFFFLIFR